MKLRWRRIGLSHEARGSNGWSFRVRPINHSGTFRVTEHRDGRRAQIFDVRSRQEGMWLAQAWEDDR